MLRLNKKKRSPRSGDGAGRSTRTQSGGAGQPAPGATHAASPTAPHSRPPHLTRLGTPREAHAPQALILTSLPVRT